MKYKNNCIIVEIKCCGHGTLRAVDSDVTSVHVYIIPRILVLPLPDVFRTLSGAHTVVETMDTMDSSSSPYRTIEPSVQMCAMTVLVHWRPIVNLSSGLKG